MWKWIISFCFIILVGLLVLSAFWTRLPSLLSNHLSSALGVEVEVKRTQVGWKRITIEGIAISNPTKTIQGKALTIDQLSIAAPFFSYFKKNILIEQIDLKGIYIDLEFDSASTTSGNWTRIMQKAKSKTSIPSSRTVLIKKLVLSEIDVDVFYKKEQSRVERLPTIAQIVLTNVSSEGGVPLDQIMNSVLGQMLKSVFVQQNLKNMLQGLLDSPENSVNKLLRPFKGFFNTTPLQAPPSE